jgi:hypothetical protein
LLNTKVIKESKVLKDPSARTAVMAKPVLKEPLGLLAKITILPTQARWCSVWSETRCSCWARVYLQTLTRLRW